MDDAAERQRQVGDVVMRAEAAADREIRNRGVDVGHQAGVYQALHEAGIEPDWVCGVSIGAINSAIIAGNKPEKRLEVLRIFWERITNRKIWHYTPDGDIFRQWRNLASAWMTSAMGQPGFFTPHQVNPWLSPVGARTATLRRAG